MTTAFTGATRIIDAHFASEISLKITFFSTKVDSGLRVSIWAGKLVKRCNTVQACTRMIPHVWRHLT